VSSHRLRLAGLVLFFVVAFLSNGQTQVMMSHDEAVKWADQTLARLTLEKKIGQMICADIAGGYITDSDPRLERRARLVRQPGRLFRFVHQAPQGRDQTEGKTPRLGE